jgi:hypothetical protein
MINKHTIGYLENELYIEESLLLMTSVQGLNLYDILNKLNQNQTFDEGTFPTVLTEYDANKLQPFINRDFLSEFQESRVSAKDVANSFAKDVELKIKSLNEEASLGNSNTFIRRKENIYKIGKPTTIGPEHDLTINIPKNHITNLDFTISDSLIKNLRQIAIKSDKRTDAEILTALEAQKAKLIEALADKHLSSYVKESIKNLSYCKKVSCKGVAQFKETLKAADQQKYTKLITQSALTDHRNALKKAIAQLLAKNQNENILLKVFTQIDSDDNWDTDNPGTDLKRQKKDYLKRHLKAKLSKQLLNKLDFKQADSKKEITIKTPTFQISVNYANLMENAKMEHFGKDRTPEAAVRKFLLQRVKQLKNNIKDDEDKVLGLFNKSKRTDLYEHFSNKIRSSKNVKKNLLQALSDGRKALRDEIYCLLQQESGIRSDNSTMTMDNESFKKALLRNLNSLKSYNKVFAKIFNEVDSPQAKELKQSNNQLAKILDKINSTQPTGLDDLLFKRAPVKTGQSRGQYRYVKFMDLKKLIPIEKAASYDAYEATHDEELDDLMSKWLNEHIKKDMFSQESNLDRLLLYKVLNNTNRDIHIHGENLPIEKLKNFSTKHWNQSFFNKQVADYNVTNGKVDTVDIDTLNRTLREQILKSFKQLDADIINKKYKIDGEGFTKYKLNGEVSLKDLTVFKTNEQNQLYVDDKQLQHVIEHYKKLFAETEKTKIGTKQAMTILNSFDIKMLRQAENMVKLSNRLLKSEDDGAMLVKILNHALIENKDKTELLVKHIVNANKMLFVAAMNRTDAYTSKTLLEDIDRINDVDMKKLFDSYGNNIVDLFHAKSKIEQAHKWYEENLATEKKLNGFDHADDLNFKILKQLYGKTIINGENIVKYDEKIGKTFKNEMDKHFTSHVKTNIVERENFGTGMLYLFSKVPESNVERAYKNFMSNLSDEDAISLTNDLVKNLSRLALSSQKVDNILKKILPDDGEYSIYEKNVLGKLLDNSDSTVYNAILNKIEKKMKVMKANSKDGVKKINRLFTVFNQTVDKLKTNDTINMLQKNNMLRNQIATIKTYHENFEKTLNDEQADHGKLESFAKQYDAIKKEILNKLIANTIDNIENEKHPLDEHYESLTKLSKGIFKKIYNSTEVKAKLEDYEKSLDAEMRKWKANSENEGKNFDLHSSKTYSEKAEYLINLFQIPKAVNEAFQGQIIAKIINEDTKALDTNVIASKLFNYYGAADSLILNILALPKTIPRTLLKLMSYKYGLDIYSNSFVKKHLGIQTQLSALRGLLSATDETRSIYANNFIFDIIWNAMTHKLFQDDRSKSSITLIFSAWNIIVMIFAILVGIAIACAYVAIIYYSVSFVKELLLGSETEQVKPDTSSKQISRDTKVSVKTKPILKDKKNVKSDKKDVKSDKKDVKSDKDNHVHTDDCKHSKKSSKDKKTGQPKIDNKNSGSADSKKSSKTDSGSADSKKSSKTKSEKKVKTSLVWTLFSTLVLTLFVGATGFVLFLLLVKFQFITLERWMPTSMLRIIKTYIPEILWKSKTHKVNVKA